MSPFQRRADYCVCGKHMLEYANEGTCVWCGHGAATAVAEHAYRRNMEHNGSVLGLRTSAGVDARVVAISRARSHDWDEDSAARAALAEEARTGRFPSSGRWQEARARDEHRPTYKDIQRLFGGWPAFRRYCADIPRERIAA